MMKITVFVTLGFVVLVGGAASFASEPLPDAENVCDRAENVKKERLARRPVEYKITVDSTCGFLPCKKTVTETRINTTRETHYVEVIRRECCEGYAITPARTCSPICLKPCKFGKCVEPNRCECSPQPSAARPGYDGPQCNRFVCSSLDRWGPNCDKECQKCSETAFCDAHTGKCACRPGWRGANCTEECTDQSSGCNHDELPYLPSLFDFPEVNIIKTDDDVSGRISAALTLESAPERAESANDDEDKRAFSRMIMAHLQINLFLVILASGLIFALFCYKKKLSQLKNELYYAAYPGSNSRGSSDSSSSGGYASVYSANQPIVRRPPMPLPSKDNQLSKNMSFAAATRNALSVGKEAHNVNDEHLCIEIGSKTERHLAMSKERSQNNIYSDINESFRLVGGLPAATDQSSVVGENQYQVPRSPVRQANETNSHSNLYEELVPNHSPAKAESNNNQQ